MKFLLNEVEQLTLNPAAEYSLSENAVTSFRKKYVKLFGANASRDQIYEEVTAGKNPPGMEHWLSLLHPILVPITDWVSDASLIIPHDFFNYAEKRCSLIEEFYHARLSNVGKETIEYRPVPPNDMYISLKELKSLFELKRIVKIMRN